MPVEFQDYYQTLGVPRDAGEADIKAAFRKLARKYHPDISKEKDAEKKFKEINEAYEVLGDPEKRKKYDRLGAHWDRESGFQPPPDWSGANRDARQAGAQEFHFAGTGFSDFFEEFFGGGSRFEGFEDLFGAASHGGRAARGPRRGQDIESDILVTLDEVFRGGTRIISLKRVDQATGQTETDKIRVRIPPGVKENQTIRVRGKGGEGISGGEPGDLFLRVRLAAHPDFRIRDSDLFYDADVAPWEAVLGTGIMVPTLGGGRIRMRIPPGTGNGSRLRARGKGLPKGPSGERGDLFVTINVRVPRETTPEERDLWEKLSRVSRFDPRGEGR